MNARRWDFPPTKPEPVQAPITGIVVYFDEGGVELCGVIWRDLGSRFLIKMASGSIYKRRPDQVRSQSRKERK